jgi:hypothetical protein
MKRSYSLGFVVFLLCLSAACQTTKPGETPIVTAQVSSTPSPTPQAPEDRGAEEVFDPTSITVEMKQEALNDISQLIQRLNTITQNKDYDSWRTYLAEDFIDKYSSPDFLDRLSQAPILKRQNIVLTSLRDYFEFVVYPSHQNDRVDDIEFIGHNRVKAITLNAKKERLVLWDLEKIDGSWKIGIGR